MQSQEIVIHPINYAIFYFLIGLLWGAFIEHMDQRTGRNRLPRTAVASLVIILTWPIMVLLFIITFVKNLTK